MSDKKLENLLMPGSLVKEFESIKNHNDESLYSSLDYRLPAILVKDTGVAPNLFQSPTENAQKTKFSFFEDLRLYVQQASSQMKLQQPGYGVTRTEAQDGATIKSKFDFLASFNVGIKETNMMMRRNKIIYLFWKRVPKDSEGAIRQKQGREWLLEQLQSSRAVLNVGDANGWFISNENVRALYQQYDLPDCVEAQALAKHEKIDEMLENEDFCNFLSYRLFFPC